MSSWPSYAALWSMDCPLASYMFCSSISFRLRKRVADAKSLASMAYQRGSCIRPPSS